MAAIEFRCNTNVPVAIKSDEAEVVHTAYEILSRDFMTVLGSNLTKNKDAIIHIGTFGNNSLSETEIDPTLVKKLQLHAEGFVIEAKAGKLYILGSDKRGTAYGILELSRLLGVSPWEWWADSKPEKRKSFILKNGFTSFQAPTVAYRGIFINDEDWGLTPWSYKTNEPSDIKGQIGPKTHARIFELLLRLRANTFWPAMHECSVAFFMTPGNKEMADKYGIFIGTSHCEPMLRNTNAEWKMAGEGKYDYVNNRENVLKFWQERVIELAHSDNIYTLGIRGVHDSKMLGANTLEEQKEALTNVLKDQRDMIARYVNTDLEKVPQVFIPYKEVLDVYNMGLAVPDDVTLLWCDDNYGYLRHLPDEKERIRKGGNGVYYHISYWGRPHDYLWLASTHPAQIYTQMKMAHDKGADNMWILNVGDIKPAEYLTELFMDMAWDINSIHNSIKGLEEHLMQWLKREFGNRNAKKILPIMNEYYRLAYIRKPEFMGGTRTEESDPKYKRVSDLPWSEQEIAQRLNDYKALEEKVTALSEQISPIKREAWFQLIEYPVMASAEMNKKQLYAQLARHGKADWALSDRAFESIVALTETYNHLSHNKWNGIMDYKPRSLPVFDKIPHENIETSLVEYTIPMFKFNGVDYNKFNGAEPIAHGLGYERGAVSLPKGSSVFYQFAPNNASALSVELCLAPNHPVNGSSISYAIQIGNEAEQIVNFRTEGRSEEWKNNVLTNRAHRITTHHISKETQRHLTVKITALEEGVLIDQIKIWNKK